MLRSARVSAFSECVIRNVWHIFGLLGVAVPTPTSQNDRNAIAGGFGESQLWSFPNPKRQITKKNKLWRFLANNSKSTHDTWFLMPYSELASKFASLTCSMRFSWSSQLNFRGLRKVADVCDAKLLTTLSILFQSCCSKMAAPRVKKYCSGAYKIKKRLQGCRHKPVLYTWWCAVSCQNNPPKWQAVAQTLSVYEFFLSNVCRNLVNKLESVRAYW